MKTFTFIRIIFCILLIIIWLVWLLGLPESEVSHSQNKRALPPTESKPPVKSQKPTVKKFDLPKLADLNIKDEKEEIKKNIDLPIYKIAILPIQMSLSLKVSEDDLKLRKKIFVDPENKNLLATSLLLRKDSNEEWTPKYFAAKNEIKTKIKTLEENLNKIINQIEPIKIIENKNGNIAIIKNNLTDKTHILKAGEEYLQLKLLEVKKDEIVFGNESINKTFSKKLH